MGIFWPAQVKPEPSTLARAGRVLHWASLVVGATPGLVVGGLALMDGDGWESLGQGFAAMFAWFTVSALAGRGLRYILAGE